MLSNLLYLLSTRFPLRFFAKTKRVTTALHLTVISNTHRYLQIPIPYRLPGMIQSIFDIGSRIPSSGGTYQPPQRNPFPLTCPLRSSTKEYPTSVIIATTAEVIYTSLTELAQISLFLLLSISPILNYIPILVPSVTRDLHASSKASSASCVTHARAEGALRI